jgi:hypothetical protein
MCKNQVEARTSLSLFLMLMLMMTMILQTMTTASVWVMILNYASRDDDHERQFLLSRNSVEIAGRVLETQTSYFRWIQKIFLPCDFTYDLQLGLRTTDTKHK